MDIKSTLLDEKITQCGETLLRLTTLPPKVKRDLQDILNYSPDDQSRNIEQSINLITLYDKAVKIITSNPTTSANDAPAVGNNKQLRQLSSNLQQLIEKLDFSGDIGDQLSDIKVKASLDNEAKQVIEHTLETLQLVVSGTIAERKTSVKFLEQVNTSLSCALGNYQQTSNQAEDELSQRQGINRELGGLISSTQSEVSNASDLGQLQKSIAPLLAQISDLSKKLEQASQREASMLEQLKHNNSQVTALLSSSQDYRKRYEDQQHKAMLDPLTKIYNRFAFSEKLESAFGRWIKNQDNLRLALLDPDNFSIINIKIWQLSW